MKNVQIMFPAVLFFLLVPAMLLCSAGKARADASTLFEYSARGMALGSAVVARKPDPSAVAYNPALITRLPGTQFQMGVLLMTPHAKVRVHDPGGDTRATSIQSAFWAKRPAAFAARLAALFVYDNTHLIIPPGVADTSARRRKLQRDA